MKVIPITFEDVSRAFASGDCPDDCEHLHRWDEKHGPGMYEPLCECRLSADGGDAEDCPIVDKFVDENDADDDQEEPPCASPS